MPSRLWEIAKDPDKRAILSWLGGGAVVVAGGIWTVVTFFVEHKDASPKKYGTNIPVSQGIASGGNTNIGGNVTIGPSKKQIEQIQKPLAEQLGQKDAQIAALTKSLLEKNPAAGRVAQQAVGAAVGSIAQGAAEGDTRLQQALDLLKANKIADATRLLSAVAEEKTARAEQATARAGQETAAAEKDRADAASAYRNLGAIAGLLRSHALLIGVSSYKSGWDQLPGVKNDLQELKAGLAPYFKTVETVANPTVAQLRDRMGEFLLGQWNKPDERLFIYYSGHGFTEFNQASQRLDGYITGSDTPLYHPTDGTKATDNALSFYDVDSWNRQTHAKHVLMVFDACFSGSLFQTKGPPVEPARTDLDSVRRLLSKPMRYYITACRQNEEAAADSTFATLLLRGLRGEADRYGEGIISADDLGNYLLHAVHRVSDRQTPQYGSIANPTLSEGQFFFLAGPAAAAKR